MSTKKKKLCKAMYGIARAATGETGKVIGIHFMEATIAKAQANADKLCYLNNEFRQGDIEQMPFADNTADVIVSNCELNLILNKDGVFNEIFRTLDPAVTFVFLILFCLLNFPRLFKVQL